MEGTTPDVDKVVRDRSTPLPAAGRTRVVLGFYAVIAVVGLLWHGMATDSNDVWQLRPQPAGVLLATPLVGVALGLAIVAGFRVLETRMAWLGDLHRELAALLGRPSSGEIVVLAGASALGEEILFRGAMLDAWGPIASSVVFAIVHVPPRASLWPWTASALILGLMLAGLTLLTGNLGAAVAAHFTINLLNLRYITRNPPPMRVTGKVVPVESKPAG